MSRATRAQTVSPTVDIQSASGAQTVPPTVDIQSAEEAICNENAYEEHCITDNVLITSTTANSIALPAFDVTPIVPSENYVTLQFPCQQTSSNWLRLKRFL